MFLQEGLLSSCDITEDDDCSERIEDIVSADGVLKTSGDFTCFG